MNYLSGDWLYYAVPRDYDQVMHFAHHRWTQDWERDGELTRALTRSADIYFG